MPDRYEVLPLPQRMVDAPWPLWGVWHTAQAESGWLREPIPDGEPHQFFSEEAAEAYAERQREAAR